MTEGTIVAVPAKPWYKSREVWMGLAQLLVCIGLSVEELFRAHPDGDLSSVLLGLAAWGGIKAFLRLRAPDIVTGITLFDGPNRPAGGATSEPLSGLSEREASSKGKSNGG